jgi:hypothetical protein
MRRIAVRSQLKYFLAGVALVALALPAWARTEHIDLTLEKPTMIGNAQVPAGHYEIEANDSKTDIMVLAKDGKVITDAQGQWIKLPTKAQDSEILYEGDHMTEVQFQGKPEAFKIS